MLLRGCHRRMICIKSANSRLFDEAFFVLREEGAAVGEHDMLAEANRILEGSTAENRYGRLSSPEDAPFGSGLLRGLFWFLLGLLTGGGSVGLLWVLL